MLLRSYASKHKPNVVLLCVFEIESIFLDTEFFKYSVIMCIQIKIVYYSNILITN